MTRKEAAPMKRRITLDIDERVLGAVDRLADRVEESRAGFIVASIEQRLAALERERVDAAFAEMADDPARVRDMVAVERELGPATEAAWQVIERDEAPAATRRGRPARKRTRGTR